MVDPIEELAPIAAERDIGFHVDSCVGGFFLPFVEKLGEPIPLFDFRVPGVTTISADLHKFGYTAKGASLIMSRDRDVFEHQPFRFGGGSRPDDWYVTPSMTGTRPGGAIAAAWAVMTYLGEAGYLDRTRRTLDYLHRWWAAIEAIDGLYIMGKPAMSVFAVASPTLDMYAVGKGMEERGWIVYMDSEPVPSLRFMQSPGHEPYVDAYMADLREVVEDGPERRADDDRGPRQLHLTRPSRSTLAGWLPAGAARPRRRAVWANSSTPHRLRNAETRSAVSMPNRPEMAAPTSGMTMVIMFTRVVSIDANVTPYWRGTVRISSSNRMRSTPAAKNDGDRGEDGHDDQLVRQRQGGRVERRDQHHDEQQDPGPADP